MNQRIRYIIAITVVSASFLWNCDNAGEGWVALFDGKTLDGWQAAENPQSFRVENGAIVCDGARAHLFYVGDVRNARFKNFEFKADVMTKPGANSGIYFHSEFQEIGWPDMWLEAQVNNTHKGAGDYHEYKKTGSLYGVRSVFKQIVNDDEWFTMHLIVQGKNVKIKVNDRLLVDYVEPDSPKRKKRLLGTGTFALQCHDPDSKVFYKNIHVKPLPDDLPTLNKAVEDRQLDETLTSLHARNFPLFDFHVHLKGKLTLEDALAKSRKYGINYGIAINCGLDFPITNDEQLQSFVDSYYAPETYLAMQAEGREWMTLFSTEAMEQFDYVFTDALTWTNDKGKRMRLWINEDVEIGDKQHFMDMYVDRIVEILHNEPIDLFVNPTFLPEVIRDEYDTLWTWKRMDRVISAAVQNDIAIEINARFLIPSATFIKRAKATGAKFAFGTNNPDENYGNLEYCLEMIKECGLTSEDMFMPEE